MKLRIATIIMALALAPMACAAPLGERLEADVRANAPAGGFMGSVLVAKGGQVLLNRGYGMADLEWAIPNAPDVKFRLGSLTKQFTSALVLLLQEDGKLNIGDPVGKYLPDAPAAWQKITIRNLLDHTSGIPNFTAAKEFGAWRMTPHDWLKEWRTLDKPLEFEPGTKFNYSNSNYELLGVIVERVGGAPYKDQLRKRLLDPVGMADTGLDEDGLILARRAQGYEPHGKTVVYARSESMTVPWAAGSMYSTTGDLLKWEKALFGGKVLRPESLRLMTTPNPVSANNKLIPSSSYALGLMVSDVGGKRVVTHGGGIEGFNTALAHAPDQDVTVVVLANRNGREPDKIAEALMKTMLTEPAP